jgi:hypothetical protein
MARTIERDGVMIGLGIEDREAYLCRVPAARVESLLQRGRAAALLRDAAPAAVAGADDGSASADATLSARIDKAIAALHGWATPEKATCLARLILQARAELSVEIGVFGGRGTIAMAMAHEALGYGYVAGIDPWSASASIEGENAPENDEWWQAVDYDAVLASFLAAVTSHGLSRQVRVMRQRSDEAVRLFADRSIAVLHQDGNHSEQVSSGEVVRWAPKIKPGGYWVADDCDWPTTAAALVLLEHQGFVLVEDHGSWRVYRKS